VASNDLSTLLPEMAKSLGADRTGIATLETLADGRPFRRSYLCPSDSQISSMLERWIKTR